MKLVILLFAILCSVTVTAQTHRKPWSIEISGGPGIPVGKFADIASSNDDATRTAGSAMTGLHIELAPSFQFSKNFAVVLTGGYMQNEQDKKELKAQAEKDYPNEVASFSTNKWKIIRVTAGLLYIADINNKLEFVSRLSAGFAKATKPDIEGFYYRRDGSSASKYNVGKEKLKASFAADISAGIRWKINSTIYLSGTIGYFTTQPEHTFPTAVHPVIITTPTPPVMTYRTYKASLSSLQPTLGFGIKF